MASKKRPCATCGKKIAGIDGTYMYDSVQNKTVFVCKDDWRCQKPYLKKVNKGGKGV